MMAYFLKNLICFIQQSAATGARDGQNVNKYLSSHRNERQRSGRNQDVHKISCEILKIFCESAQRCFLPVFFSSRFTTMAVMNPPEKTLEKRTSVKWLSDSM